MRFDTQQNELMMLTKTRHELQAEIPPPVAMTDVSQMPAAVSIKQALDNQEQAKAKRDATLKEALENLSNLNIIDELLNVHQGQAQKDAVFAEKRQIFEEFFKKMSQ